MEKVPLTPNKIQRLMYLAEDKSFNTGLGASIGRLNLPPRSNIDKSNNECSSGLLDLDDYEAFGECSGTRPQSLSKFPTFNPGEMTGRSTEADDQLPANTTYGRHSEAAGLYDLEQRLNKQSEEVQEIMRQSICSGMTCSFRTRDLTADESAFIHRDAPVPSSQINMDLKESKILDPAESSMGAYFQTRCSSFSNVIGRTDSPRYDVSELSIADEPPSIPPRQDSALSYSINNSGLDSIPVKQPRRTFTKSELAPSASNFKPISPAQGTKLVQQLFVPGTVRQYSQLRLDPSKQHLNAFRTNTEESTTDDSVNLSAIQMYLGASGQESNVDYAHLMKLLQAQKKQNKNPLGQVDTNTEENRQRVNPDIQVSYLKDSKGAETASSAGTVSTVIDLEKLKISNQENIPKQIVSSDVLPTPENLPETRSFRTASRSRSRSKSPSSKSPSTLSTVKDNFGSSFKSSGSPVLVRKGEAKASDIPSPNVIYKELDKSVDWQEVLQMKGRPKSEGMAKGEFLEISVSPIAGMVGVSTVGTISLKSSSESWLTARFEFNLPPQSRDITVDLPRFPMLLPPGKTEYCTVHITSTVEMATSFPITFYIKDSCMDKELVMQRTATVAFKMPDIKLVTGEKNELVNFPPVQEESIIARPFYILSDCDADLQLELSIADGGNMFSIIGAQELSIGPIKKQEFVENENSNKYKSRGPMNQLCKLSRKNMLKIMLVFVAPKFRGDTKEVLNGVLDVKLMGTRNVLRRVVLVAVVGTVNLQIQPTHVILDRDLSTIPIQNSGSVKGTWLVGFSDSAGNKNSVPFKLMSNKLAIDAGATSCLQLMYTGPLDQYTEAVLSFEEVAGKSARKYMKICGGKKKPIPFPVKTCSASLSWVREGRKEISMKNTFETKVHVKCKVIGEGFYLDLPRSSGSNVVTMVTFGPLELRSLPVKFEGPSNRPCAACLYMVYEKNGEEITRKILLFGCASGDAMSWLADTITMGVNAQVRAMTRHPIELRLKNRSTMPSFLAASVRFNLTYRQVEPSARMSGARRIVPGRDTATVTLHVDWGKIEKTTREAPVSVAPTLATITVFTGAEITRKRILKLLNKKSLSQGRRELDVSSLPENLKTLAGPFEGEDAFRFTDDLLKNFNEPESSLEELLGGIQELSAQVDLAQGFEDNTILVTDDTILEHHTLPAC